MNHYPCIMATSTIVSLFGMCPFSLQAAEQTDPTHQGMNEKPTDEKSATAAPAIEKNGDETYEAQSPPGRVGANWPKPVEDSQWGSLLVVDQLEYRMHEGADTMRWDIVGWYGGDYNRLWLKTEGEWKTAGERGGEFEVQALYGRLIAPFWDVQIGVRHDHISQAGFDHSRELAVVGLQGLAPYWFELEPALFISQDGDVSARLTATNDLLLTQRLILQPRLDVDAAGQSVKNFGVGEGINSIGLGLRLRYEIRREFAPYLGVQWLRRLGETADNSRRDGERAADTMLVFGARIWF